MKHRLLLLVYCAAIGPLLATFVYATYHAASTGRGVSPAELFMVLIMGPLIASPVMVVFALSALASGFFTRDLPILWFCGLFGILASAGYMPLVMAASHILGPNNFIMSTVRPEDLPAYALHLASCLTFTFLILGLRGFVQRLLKPYQTQNSQKPK